MSRIDRIRHAALVRRANRAEAGRAEDAHGASDANLPVAVAPAAATRTFKDDSRQGYSEVAAQLMGQHGERRGLRAGPGLFGAASNAYNSVEWSGRYDRRARKGGQARTEI
ncbi:hypothetical protein [Phenylobacterium sp.]|uniref:hypothetical protein n=1 Tax=Phenylobacterium sp. TaxID=1871053 RepID=UPI003D294FAE